MRVRVRVRVVVRVRVRERMRVRVWVRVRVGRMREESVWRYSFFSSRLSLSCHLLSPPSPSFVHSGSTQASMVGTQIMMSTWGDGLKGMGSGSGGLGKGTNTVNAVVSFTQDPQPACCFGWLWWSVGGGGLG